MLTNRILLFLILFFNSTFAFSQDQNLILHYSFEGNTIDQSIYQNNGQAVNAVPASNFEGNAESAYLFNGIDSYISAGEDSSLEVNDALSIQAQIQPLGPGSDNAGGIIVNKEGEYSLARFADGSLRYAIAFSNNWGVHVNTGVYIPLNEKTHVALVYDRFVGKINLYVNCELVYSKNEDRVIQDSELSLDELRIGARQALPQFFFGIIDEVSVYNKGISPEDFDCISTSTDEFETYQQVELYPNPTSDVVQIKNLNFVLGDIKIMDTLGRLIKTLHNHTAANTISLVNLPAGAYFIQLTDAKTNFRITRKVIKQ